MLMTVKCPACGEKSRMPESAFGQQVKCPACSALFQCGPGPSPVQATPQVRAADPQPQPGIRYSCPRCGKPLESPAHAAGQKVNCPDCGQRLQIPQPPASPASVPVRVVAPAPPPAPPREELIPTVVAVPPPAPPAPVRQEHCLECGRDITDRPRVQTCPDCGSLFCSAMCFREHQHHAHSSRRR